MEWWAQSADVLVQLGVRWNAGWGFSSRGRRSLVGFAFRALPATSFGRWPALSSDMMNGMPVHTEVMTRDAIEYELSVRDEVTGYYGGFFCQACWQGWVKYDLVPIVAEALEDARKRASLHHLECHAQ